jgi:predicted nucleic acid-binding Zn ribbon protein
VRSTKERVDEITEDPVKLKRAFTFVWAVAYGMLILGLILIVYFLVQGF